MCSSLSFVPMVVHRISVHRRRWCTSRPVPPSHPYASKRDQSLLSIIWVIGGKKLVHVFFQSKRTLFTETMVFPQIRVSWFKNIDQISHKSLFLENISHWPEIDMKVRGYTAGATVPPVVHHQIVIVE
jgi:hypothetical protein